MKKICIWLLKGYKKVISSCINAIVTFVTLSTADYSKAVDLFKKL